MSTQHTYGIEDLDGNDIIQLAPKRVDARQLQRMENAELLRLRNILQVEANAFQEGRSQEFDRLNRVDAEIKRRGLDVWLSQACDRCGERNSACLIEYRAGAPFGAECACVRGINAWTRKAV